MSSVSGKCSSDASFLFCFSGNWNGTESVEEWGFLWRARYDLFPAQFNSQFLVYSLIQNQTLSCKAKGCCGVSADLLQLSVWCTGRACSQVSAFTRLDAICLLCGELMRTHADMRKGQIERCKWSVQKSNEGRLKQRFQHCSSVLLPHNNLPYFVCLVCDDNDFLVSCFAFKKRKKWEHISQQQKKTIQKN